MQVQVAVLVGALCAGFILALPSGKDKLVNN